MTRDRSTAGIQKERQDKTLEQQIAREIRIKDLQTVLSTREGLRVLWRILEAAGVFRSAMTGNSNTFYLLGRADVGKEILADLAEAYPDGQHWLAMQKMSQAAQEITNGR